MDKIEAVAASAIASAAIQAALVAALQAKGILTDSEVSSVYEHALLLLEEERGLSADTTIIDAARAVIEEHL